MHQDALLAFCLLLQGQKGSLGILPASGAQTCHTTLRARFRATCHESFVTALCRSEMCGRRWKFDEVWKDGEQWMLISPLSIALRAATIQHHLATASDSSRAVRFLETEKCHDISETVRLKLPRRWARNCWSNQGSKTFGNTFWGWLIRLIGCEQ